MPDSPEQVQQELLPQCTVRVVIGERHAGTGFYVAHGLVATCDHVVRPALAEPGARDAIAVVDVDDARREAEIVKGSEQLDVAVLRLRTPHDHPCVLLDADLRPNDSVHSVGFPQEKYFKGLVPTTLVAEGQIQGTAPWFKLKEGQVRPGMSGSPVLNNRTGGVCGVLKRTRDEKSDLGGYAVPVTLLAELYAPLLSENERYHTKNRRWLELLPADVRRLRNAAQGTRMAEAAAEMQFVVEIGQVDDGWSVSAIVDGVSEIGPVPIDLNLVRIQIARLFREWAARGRIRLVGGDVGLLGSILFSALFPGPIGKRLDEVRAMDRRVAVVLHFDDNMPDDLKQLPWEHLFVPSGGFGGVALAREPGLTFYRALRVDLADDVRDLQSLSVLVVPVKPREVDDERRRTAQEVEGVCAALNQLGGIGVLSIEQLESADVGALRDEVAGYDVVHYVGFGEFSNGLDAVAFVAEDTADGVEYVEIETFREAVLRGAPNLALVVLQLCEAPFVRVPADLAVVGTALLDRVPAVIGCQSPMTSEAAVKFNEVLYEQLTRGTPVDVAVQEARGRIAPHGRLSVSPALFQRAPGTVRLTSQRREVARGLTQSAFARP